MELHKWSASNPLLLPDSMCQVKDLSYSSSTETKILGLLWKSHPDSFTFKISPMTSNCDNLIVTKKSVISTIARIFDPLGLIGPVITRAIILLQSLWQLKLDWNDPLPSNLVSYCKSFIDALESINCLDIPPYCLQDKSIRMASLTRLKRLTVLHFTYDALIQVEKSLLGSCAPNQSQKKYLQTNSSIVLAWIKKPLAQLKTFVRNKVSIIQELTESDFWKHVNSESNPADFLSRGISPDKIQHCELWWFGPPFLHQYKELEPYDITTVERDDLFLQEMKETSDFPLCALLKNFEQLDIISNCSSFTKLQRVIAWCAEATLANIRNSFWIPSARNVVRKILRICITCRKVSAKGSQQLMTDLPAARVTACRVFSQVVKAIHLEIVSDLTTEAFLTALKRFVAKKGRPIEIHSDNVQIEAVLYSRPICPLSNDPNDVETLTPAHFIAGSSLVAVPDPDYTEIPMNRLSQWQLVQRMSQHFWGKWSSEYLNRLQQRPKWCKSKVGFKEGDLVLVNPSENSDRLKWHLARILKLHPGKDNIVRVVTLKDKQGIYKRPVTKIANLPYVN
ncbi:integrase catalytic domain-containing protein [Trichonephila clavipes]|nr:integrase catalytic domain-containing protein [Trichonephila clavipes]